MNIGILARGLTKGGVTRVINNLLSEFDKSYEHNFFLFTDDKKYEKIYNNIKVVFIENSNKILWDYIKSRKYLKKYNLDMIIYPKNIIPFTHKNLNAKKVNIVHDLAYFDNKLNEYKKFDTLYMKTFMKKSCLLSDKIIAVSQSTKDDIVKRFGIDKKKIIVAHEGVENNFKVLSKKELEITIKKFNLEIPFIFYCGSLSPRKNILRALKAFNKIKDKVPHKIYLAGGQSWNDSEVLEYIDKNLNNRVIKVGYLSEEELVHFYNISDLYIYPSIYEGFGLPILEAQSCGCPVLTSNLTSCPEVAGDGAVIVEAYDIGDIKKKMYKILTDKNYKKKIIEKGYENVKKFSWGKMADKIIGN